MNFIFAGETYNGNLVKCDTWMNIYLRDVICTSKDGNLHLHYLDRSYMFQAERGFILGMRSFFKYL